MIFFSIKSSKYFHWIDNISFLLWSFSFKLLSSLKIQQSSLNNKLLSSYSFIEPRIIQFNNRIFEFNLLFCILLKKLHISEKQLCIHIIFLIKVSSLWEITNDFFACLNSRCITPTFIITSIILSIFLNLLLLLATLLINTADILVLKTYLILILLILYLNLLVKLIIFLLNFFFSFNLELFNSLDSNTCFRAIYLNYAFNLTILFIFNNLSWLSK